MTPPTVQFIPAAGGGFLPSDLASLDAWYDANNGSTITESGGYISDWASASGVANDFAQATFLNQPQVNSGYLNGLDTVAFSSEDSMQASLTSGLSSSSLFVVMETTLNSKFIMFTGNFPTLLLIAESGSTAAISNGAGTPVYFHDGDASGWANRGDCWADIGYNQGWSIVSITSLNLSSFGTFKINKSGFSGYNFGGDVAEVILFSSSLGTSDREKVEGYLAHKWGLTANLSAGHPYKTVAP